MKKIYILLTRTDTIPARIIRKFVKGEFSHTSISFLPRTDKFYSFARRKINNPMFAGFISEDIHTKVFAKYPNAHSALYCLDVEDDAYERATDIIRDFREHRKEATYSFVGAVGMKIGLKIKRGYKFTCSQFVAFVISASGAAALPKDPYLMMPCDFMLIEGIKLIYDGPLKDCVIPQ